MAAPRPKYGLGCVLREARAGWTKLLPWRAIIEDKPFRFRLLSGSSTRWMGSWSAR